MNYFKYTYVFFASSVFLYFALLLFGIFAEELLFDTSGGPSFTVTFFVLYPYILLPILGAISFFVTRWIMKK
ncbi:MAG: hypothetical protein WCT49_02310 [Candidatus Paceibacterota bacterium]